MAATYYYYPFAGRGELARLIAAAGGVELIEGGDGSDLNKAAFGSPGSVPLLAHGDLKIAQSGAIESYLSFLAFPDLAPSARAVDAQFGCIKEDITAGLVKVIFGPGKAQRSAEFRKLFGKWFSLLEKLIPTHGFINGLPYPTTADLVVLNICEALALFGTAIRNAKINISSAYPKMAALSARTAKMPNVQAYMAHSSTLKAPDGFGIDSMVFGEVVVQAAWDNHISAFGAQDVEKILLDYSEKSVITLYDQLSGTKTVFKGLAGAKQGLEGLFKNLYDCSDLTAPVQVVKEATAAAAGSVFLVWSCKASGYSKGTDTFVFDDAGKIVWQNVVVTYKDPKGDGKIVAKNDTEAPTGSGLVHDGWTNHFAAFGGQDVPKVLLDYTEDSEITVYNQADGSQSDYVGLAGAKTCFEGLFKSLFDCSSLAAPVIHVEESKQGEAGQVLLIWSCPGSGYTTATDTFIFNTAGKIVRQIVVVEYKSPK